MRFAICDWDIYEAAEILVQQAWLGFGAFLFLPDRSAWYDPGIPLLSGVPAGLFLFGLVIALFKSRRGLVCSAGLALIRRGFGGMMAESDSVLFCVILWQ